jgi:hypothetical protein
MGNLVTLEYGCMLVFRICDGRLERILTEDDRRTPAGTRARRRATTVRHGIRHCRRGRVAADRLADRFDTVSDDGWLRTGNRSDGARFTVDSFARYLVHDIVHHVEDVAPRA